MDNTLVLFETDSAFREELGGIMRGRKVLFIEDGNTDSLDAETAACTTVIFGNPNANFLKVCPRLEWLQLHSAGANSYINGEVSEKVLLTCASGCYGHAISEYMTALTLGLMKKLHLYRDEQPSGRWNSLGQVKSVQGSVVLVIGLGDIGGEYARRMKALGAYVIGVRRTAHAKPDYVDELLVSAQIDDALPVADVIALAAPGTKATAGLIGRPQIARMKKDAILINSGRGSAIDTEALCDALESGILGGVGLDVTEPEPLPPEHRLWKLKNAVITPHISGGRSMAETVRNIMRLSLENASRYVRGEVLKSRVDLKTGYRIPED